MFKTLRNFLFVVASGLTVYFITHSLGENSLANQVFNQLSNAVNESYSSVSESNYIQMIDNNGQLSFQTVEDVQENNSKVLIYKTDNSQLYYDKQNNKLVGLSFNNGNVTEKEMNLTCGNNICYYHTFGQNFIVNRKSGAWVYFNYKKDKTLMKTADGQILFSIDAYPKSIWYNYRTYYLTTAYLDPYFIQMQNDKVSLKIIKEYKSGDIYYLRKEEYIYIYPCLDNNFQLCIDYSGQSKIIVTADLQNNINSYITLKGGIYSFSGITRADVFVNSTNLQFKTNNTVFYIMSNSMRVDGIRREGLVMECKDNPEKLKYIFNNSIVEWIRYDNQDTINAKGNGETSLNCKIVEGEKVYDNFIQQLGDYVFSAISSVTSSLMNLFWNSNEQYSNHIVRCENCEFSVVFSNTAISDNLVSDKIENANKLQFVIANNIYVNSVGKSLFYRYNILNRVSGFNIFYKLDNNLIQLQKSNIS